MSNSKTKSAKLKRFSEIEKAAEAIIKKSISINDFPKNLESEIKQLDDLGVLKYVTAGKYFKTLVNKHFGINNSYEKLIYDEPDSHIKRKRIRIKKIGNKNVNPYVEIETKNLIHDITSIDSLRKKLDCKKIPAGYNELLNTKEPKLKNIIKFLRSYSNSAEILLNYVHHIYTENEKSIYNRDKIISLKNKFTYEKINELIKANKRIIELSDDVKELGRLKIENESLREEQKGYEDTIEAINKKKKWIHLKPEIQRLYGTGKKLEEAIKYVIDNSKDNIIKIELSKGVTEKNLIENIRRNIYR